MTCLMSPSEMRLTVALVIFHHKLNWRLAKNSKPGLRPPFLNTHEVELPGVLPLGLNPNERYENQEVVLAPGDRLTLYTDGLLEARDSKGELFGFERLAKLVGNTAAAEDAIAAGVQFG
jgi:hypothetical protein